MNGESRPTILTEVLGDVVRRALGSDEDKDLSVLGANLLEMLDKLVTLLKVADNVDDLLDVVVGGELHGTNVTLDHVLQEILKRRVRCYYTF